MGIYFSRYQSMKHIVKILTLLVAISALWIGLLQSSILPHGRTWLVSLHSIIFFLDSLYLFSLFYTLSGAYFACLATPATHLFYCLPGMLWSVDGWNRSNDISNLPCRRTVAAEGTASLLLSSALSCHTTKDPLFSLSPFSLECSPSFHIQGITKIEMLVLANQSEPSLG